ncbi:MAG: hypothetical protein H6669_07465 [Ardenticatenaceae bacterium]|nr:hypothetical protein [Ardenticatenaceae bacterium]
MMTLLMEGTSLQEELARIPPEYQDVFRATIEGELRQAAISEDQEVLRFLRGRLTDFQRGAFIRPDGRTGMMTLGPDGKYAQALDAMAKGYEGTGEDAEKERRATMLKIGGIVVVAVLFLLFAFRGRGSDEDEAAAQAAGEGTPAAAITNADVAGLPTPTPEPLPETAGNVETLRSVGGSGGGLTLGRPASLELHYSASEQVLALAIDPSQTTPRGELTYQEAIMLSENPLAVWLFGTVLNYAIGIPDSMVRSLQPEDRIILNTDTGASLQFVVAEVDERPNYATSELFSQDRIGMTLFALPAISEDNVAIAIANYDISQENVAAMPTWEIGDSFPLGPIELRITDAAFNHTLNGRLDVAITGEITGEIAANTVLLSLSSSADQTESIDLQLADETTSWGSAFTVSEDVQGTTLFSEFRVFPSGDVETVRLGEAPRLAESLQITMTESVWHLDRGEATVRLSILNPGDGAVRLGPDYFQTSMEGGDLPYVVVPNLPVLIPGGETVVLDVSFIPAVLDQNVRMRIGSNLWEVSGFPNP